MAFIGQQTIKVVRRAQGTRGADGRYTAGVTSEFTIKATVNPITGRDLSTLPDGLQSGDVQKISATKFAFQTVDEGDAQTLPDLVVYQGRTYQVELVRVYETVIPHREVIMRRIAP